MTTPSTPAEPAPERPHPISLERARDVVYEHGALWERAIFAQLLEGGDRARTLRCLALHQNDDGGWAHALEPDVRSPASNAVATEFALGVMREFDLADGALLAETARWCAAAQTESGDFELGDGFHRYPRAAWWRDARRWPPTAIVGRLAALLAATPALLKQTRRWAERHAQPTPDAWPATGLSAEHLRGLDGESWRYHLYHYADYFLHVGDADLPRVASPSWLAPAESRAAGVAKAVERARAQPDAECALGGGSTPRLPAGAVPSDLVARRLAALAAGQQGDGGWGDVHGLPQWRPLATVWALKALREHAGLPAG